MAIITQEQMVELLDKCYTQAISGIKGGVSCEVLAEEYLTKYGEPKLAAKNWNEIRCQLGGIAKTTEKASPTVGKLSAQLTDEG